MTRRVASIALAVALPIVSACASAPAIPPGGVGDYVQEGIAEAYFEGVMRHCVATAFTAQMLARGSVDGHRLNRRVWLSADRVSGSLRLESIEPKQPLFTFFVKDVFRRQADIGWTLFSPQGNWVARGEDSREVIETIVGLPLSAEEFLWTMTGCSPNLSGSLLTAQRFGTTVMKISVGGVPPLEVELQRKNDVSPWTLYAMSRTIPGRTFVWRVELDDHVGGVHQRIRGVSRQSSGDEGAAFDVRLSLSHLHVNPRLSPDTFSPAVPTSARVMSLETLRQDTFK